MRHPCDSLLQSRKVPISTSDDFADEHRFADRPVILDDAIAEEPNSNAHRLSTEVLRFVTLQELAREILHKIPAFLVHGSAAIDIEDDILVGDTDLIANALMSIAILHFIPMA
jgi:hypothetical protein